MTAFENRRVAGRLLATALAPLRGADVVVLGLPRGGVPVAFEVARALGAELDVIVVRKLGLPFQPEVAMGAIGEGGERVLDDDLVRRAQVTAAQVQTVELRERQVLDARVAEMRRDREPVSLRGRTAVVVDDGIATGSTARAACEIARRLGAARVVMAAPVAPARTTASDLAADDLVCLMMPAAFGAVGEFYRDFAPTTDDEAITLLDAARTKVENEPSGF